MCGAAARSSLVANDNSAVRAERGATTIPQPAHPSGCIAYFQRSPIQAVSAPFGRAIRDFTASSCSDECTPVQIRLLHLAKYDTGAYSSAWRSAALSCRRAACMFSSR
jgi:hypothetical protein